MKKMWEHEEIDKFCMRLMIAWREVPELRFGQFMWNMISFCQNHGKDAFYLENDEFMDMVNQFLKECKCYECR